MKSIFNKANAPYLVSGALATSALLASGVFTVAPYIGFLAPVAALSVGLPLIVVAAVFSFVTIAFSCAAISKNNTIAEKKDQLNQQSNEIARLEEQLSSKEAEVKAHKQKISEKNNQTTKTVVKNVALSNQVGIAEENLSIQEKSRTLSRKKHVTFNEQANQVKNITPYQEEFIGSSVNRIVKDAYSAMPSADSVRNWIPSSKTVRYIARGGLISVATYAATNGLVATDTSPNAVNPIAKDLGNHTLSSNSHHIPVSLQITMENKTNEYSRKLDDALESAKNNFGIPKDHSEPQWFKDLHKSETTEEIIDNRTLPNLFSEGSNSDYQCAKPNVIEQASVRAISETDTAVATHSNSNTNTSDTCPANYETSLAKSSSTDTCSSQDVCPSDYQFGSHEHLKSGKAISESGSSNVVPFCAKVSNDTDTSKFRGTLVNSVELERLRSPSFTYPKGLPRVF